MFQVKGIGHFLLDMIQEEGKLSILIYRKKMILKIKKMIRKNIRQSRKIMEGRQMKKTKKIMIQAQETILQFLMMMSMKICSKMTLMTMMISSILSTSFQNQMMIQMSSLMKKIKIENKDDYTDDEVGLGMSLYNILICMHCSLKIIYF